MKLIFSALLIWVAYVLSMLTEEEQNVLELEYQNNLACAKHQSCCEPSLVKNIKDVRIKIVGKNHKERRCRKTDEPCIKEISIKFKLSHEPTTSAYTMESLAVHSAEKGNTGYEMKKPLLIKIKQHKPRQFYNLLNVGTVNSDPYEVVYNKHDENFTGCSLMDSPTCGICTYEHREIPFSRGFCCSCDEGKNKDDCPDSDMLMREDENYIMYFQKTDDNHTCDQDKMRRLNYIVKRISNTDESNNPEKPKYVLNVKRLGPVNLHRKYRTGKTITQIRGGQNCEDKYTPPGLDPMTYHDSAHCLRFSKVWFGVYRLDHVTYIIRFTVKLYRRQSVAKWKMIAPSIDIVNEDTFYEDNSDQPISVHVGNFNPPNVSHVLEEMRILMPADLKRSQLLRYPETRNGAREFLVVSPGMIAMEGDQCDKIGVSFNAFAKQRKRCRKPKGSCLANQPKKLWRHDSDKEKRNLKGKYFLKYYLNTKRDIIKMNPKTKRKELHVSYQGEHCVDFEIKLSSEFCKDLCEKKIC